MRRLRNDLPRPATRGRLTSPALIRLYRARAPARRRDGSTPPAASAGIRRGRRLAGLLGALAVSVLPALLPDAARAERTAAVEVAMVTDLAGRVERQPRTIERWNRVGLDEAVALFDAMRTWDASTAELRFVDGTVVMLDEKTRLRISPMLFDPDRAPQEVRLALAAGSAEIRAGAARLWIDTGGDASTIVEPGGSLRITADGEGGVDVRPPRRATPSDLERDRPTAPGPRADRPGDDRPRPLDPADGRVDPTEVVDQVIDTVPGGIGVDARLPGADARPDDGILRLPPLPENGFADLPTLPDGPDGLLRDLIPGGIVVGLDGLPPVPITGQVRVEVEIRRR